MGNVFSAGDWTVKDGYEEKAFIDEWAGSMELDPPIAGLVRRARLLRDLDHPGHFLSFAEWESLEALEAFRARPDFQERIGRIRESTDFRAFTLEQVAGG